MCRYYIYLMCPKYGVHTDMELTSYERITWKDIQVAKNMAREVNNLSKEDEIFVVNIYKLESE